MSKFNTQSSPTKTVNLAGGEAYTQDPKMEFVSILLTSFVKNQFYRKEDDTIKGLAKLIGTITDRKFMAKAAIYARTKYGMRSVSHVVAGEIGSYISGQAWAKNFYDKIVFRPDDMTEILAYIYNKGGKESNAIRKGFARAFNRFDEYQLAKYKKDGAVVSLIDVANIVHPTHTEAVERLIKGTLPTPKTWEAKLSEAGKKAENDENKETLKKEVWKELLETKKIGYFALLRNLRNILEQAPEMVPAAISMLIDENLIRKSLVLPFRYVTAIEEIQQLNGHRGVREIIGGISIAIDKATSNVPRFDGDTLVVLDGSGSMEGKPITIGSLFAAVLVKSNNADYMSFSDDAKYYTPNTIDSTTTIAAQIVQTAKGGGTNFHSIFETANRPYDRIIILSDMQGWVGYQAPVSTFNAYKKRVGANPKIYSFDLQGYGTLQFPEPNVFCLAGFSEKVFDVMKMLEQDKQALIHEIEKIEL